MTPISRRQFVRIAATGAAALRAPAVFAASNMTKIKVGGLPLVDFTPLYAAHAKGFFKAHRLDVDLRVATGGPAFAALVAGDLDIGVSSLVVDLVAADRGIVYPLVACGGAVGAGPPHDEAALIVRRDGAPSAGKDWNHKRIGVVLVDSISTLATSMWVDGNGGDSKTLSFVEIPFPQMNDALLDRRVDAIQQNEPFVSQLVEGHPSAVKIVSWVFSATLPNTLIAGLFAGEPYIAQNRAAVEAFNHAYDQGVDWVNANLKTPQFYELVSSYSKLPIARLKSLLGLPRFEKKVTAATFLELASAMQRYKMIKALPDPKRLVFPAVLAS